MVKDLADRGARDLVVELFHEFQRFFSDTLELARTEMSKKFSLMAKESVMMIAGGAVAFAGFIILLHSIWMILALVLPAWLSALLVGVVVTGGGALVALTGKKRMQNMDMTPRQTLESLREDKEWAKRNL